MRAARYRIALLSLFAAVAPTSCRTFTEPFLDVGQVDHVDVFGGLVEAGDTISASADAFKANGIMTAVTGVDVFWRTADIGVASVDCCARSVWLHSSKVYGTTGTTAVTATVAHATGTLQVTVTP